ncbi:chymotrypsin inhibitor-like [Anoplophora glabripennis]|uniref:chymotrypsin inhibitor-like n=1 Tax=Anoplophora glabripennis TaxID=217634 RepID=UPI00087548DA|nr:chymotrypsin inhibitor-like [Anoplophora glabripennis]
MKNFTYSCCLLLLTVFVTGEASDECDDPNAYYDSCGSACPPTCQIRRPGYCIQVCVAGCFCKKDFTLDEESGKCVKCYS